jgi:6-pyruvoyltetrahydropterin/6-carboxytetrahydropterin synthase
MGFKVVVSKNSLHFAASHFITVAGKCEFLHGHNYAVTVELEGPLTADSYVFDFVALKKMTRAICETLDHCFLLATCNPHLNIQHHDRHWQIDYNDRHYVFPEKDVKPLPVDNITAERLAEYISGQIVKELNKSESQQLASLTVGVEESEGQTAYFTHLLAGTGAD